MLQDEVGASCPYCGEPITLLVDLTGGDQTYTEDCFVCCQPIVVTVAVDALGAPQVTVRAEHE